jgi:uncharacterized membrane protein HdeD (DUF308 family)
MSTATSPSSGAVFRGGPHDLRQNWFWFLVWGLVLVAVGTLAIVFAFVATLTTVLAFGILLLVGGVAEVVGAFWARGWGGFFIQLLAGILYVVVGLLMIENPVGAAVALTLMLAAVFLVGGLLRIIASVYYKFPGWGWVLFNGIVTLLLGLMIWRRWPEDSLWLIGLFVGIELICSGIAWLMLALGVRALPGPAA